MFPDCVTGFGVSSLDVILCLRFQGFQRMNVLWFCVSTEYVFFCYSLFSIQVDCRWHCLEGSVLIQTMYLYVGTQLLSPKIRLNHNMFIIYLFISLQHDLVAIQLCFALFVLKNCVAVSTSQSGLLFSSIVAKHVIHSLHAYQ